MNRPHRQGHPSTTVLAENWHRSCASLFPANRPPMTWLEIGVYRAWAAKWALANVLTVDGDRYLGIDPCKRQAARALARHPNATVIFGRSWDVLRANLLPNLSVDVAYVDGLHTPLAVLTDCCMVWPLVRVGGVLIVDDLQLTPAMNFAIDAFYRCLGGKAEVLFANAQMGLHKTDADYAVDGGVPCPLA